MSDKKFVSDSPRVIAPLVLAVRIPPFLSLRINDAAEKVGKLFGPRGQQIGKDIDDKTKDVEVRIGW